MTQFNKANAKNLAIHYHEFEMARKDGSDMDIVIHGQELQTLQTLTGICMYTDHYLQTKIDEAMDRLPEEYRS